MTKISRFKSNIFLYFWLSVTGAHFLLPLNWGDDKIFNSETIKSFADFLDGSSRILTDTMTYVFCRWHILWRIINPLVVLLLAYVICKLLSNIYNKSVLTVCLTVLYPTMVMVDAGFIATTVNYLWPITFGLFNLYILKKDIEKCKVPLWQRVLGIISLVYAINMEQMTLVLTSVFLLAIVWQVYKKEIKAFTVIQTIMSVCGLVYAYLGNIMQDNSRMVREIGRYFPNFESLNIFQKIEMGFSSTFFCMIMTISFASVAFLFFTSSISFVMFKSRAKKWQKIISLIPPVSSVICSVTNTIFNFTKTEHFKMTKAEYRFDFIADIFYLIIIAIIIYELYILIDNKTDLIKALFVLVLGLGTRMVMGFSPTVWASGYRTFAIMFIGFIMVGVFISRQKDLNRGKNETACK